MKLVVLKHGKRLLIDTEETPDYKQYLQEDGTPFPTEEEVIETEIVEEEGEETVSELFICTECFKSYKSEAGLKKHSKTHS